MSIKNLPMFAPASNAPKKPVVSVDTHEDQSFPGLSDTSGVHKPEKIEGEDGEEEIVVSTSPPTVSASKPTFAGNIAVNLSGSPSKGNQGKKSKKKTTPSALLRTYGRNNNRAANRLLRSLRPIDTRRTRLELRDDEAAPTSMPRLEAKEDVEGDERKPIATPSTSIAPDTVSPHDDGDIFEVTSPLNPLSAIDKPQVGTESTTDTDALGSTTHTNAFATALNKGMSLVNSSEADIEIPVSNTATSEQKEDSTNTKGTSPVPTDEILPVFAEEGIGPQHDVTVNTAIRMASEGPRRLDELFKELSTLR